MDNYIEELYKKKKGAKGYIIMSLCIAVGILITLFTALLIFGAMASTPNYKTQIATGFGPILIVVIWFLIYKLNGMLNLEFEYIVINNSLDIDKIMMKKSRKRIVSVDIKEINLMASVNDNDNNGAYKNRPVDAKVINCSHGSENMDTYFIDCVINNTRTFILLQPTGKLVESLAEYNPQKVKINRS